MNRLSLADRKAYDEVFYLVFFAGLTPMTALGLTDKQRTFAIREVKASKR